MKIGVKRAQKQDCLENDDSGGSSIAIDMRTCCRHDAVLHSYACVRTIAAALWWVQKQNKREFLKKNKKQLVVSSDFAVLHQKFALKLVGHDVRPDVRLMESHGYARALCENGCAHNFLPYVLLINEGYDV